MHKAIIQMIDYVEPCEKMDHMMLQVIQGDIAHIDKLLANLHDGIESTTQKWRKPPNSTSSILESSKGGSTLPISFVIAVTVDCLVDGFLIGVSCALAPKAGIVVGAANCLEMATLGMAYATRISKCTDSSVLKRMLALYVPPFMMFLNSGFGAFIGVSAKSIPAVYITLVAIGAVALLSLAFNELIVEARQAQGEKERWYIGFMIFWGIWVIITFSRFTEEE